MPKYREDLADWMTDLEPSSEYPWIVDELDFLPPTPDPIADSAPR
jgi:hypothetical protein